MNFDGKIIVRPSFDLNNLKFQVLNSVLDFDQKSECIVLDALNPDFSIIIGSISLIIAQKGSSLSHLAIIARENGVGVILIKDIITKIKKKGKISVKGELVQIENK